MSEQEHISDPVITVLPAKPCMVCDRPIAGAPHFTDTGHRCCGDCYADYVKTKYGGSNHNPDGYRVM